MNLTKQQFAMVVVILCGALLVVLNATLLSPVLPTLMKEFNVNATTVQWLVSGYTLAEAVTVPLSAYLVGRFTTRKLFMGGIGLFIAGSLLAAVAPIFPLLLLGRMAQAVAAGIVMPMGITLIMLIFPRESRGSAMGIITLVIGFAPSIGPTLGGLMSDVIGWRWLFIAMAIIAVAVIGVAIKTLTNFEDFDRYKLDVPSVILMACGMVFLLYGISSITSATNVAVPVALIVLGAVLLAIFVHRQLTLDEPMLKVAVLKSRRFRTAVVTVMIIQAAIIGVGVILPLYIQNVLGYSATVSGLVMLPGALLGAFTGLIAGRLFDRYGLRALVVTGATIFFAAGLGTATFTIDSSLVYVTVLYSGLGFAMQMMITPMNTWGINSLDNRVIQHANSLQNSLNQVAGSIGTAFLSALTALGATALPEGSALEQAYMGDHIAFIGLACIAGTCALVVYVFARNKKSDEVREAELAQSALGAPTEIAWTVGQAMDRQPKLIRTGATIGDAFKVFAETETDGLPIINENAQVVGYISDGDVLNYLGQKDMGFANASANMFVFVDNEHIQNTMVTLFKMDVMTLATKKVITLDTSMTLEKACSVFFERKLKKVPVLENGKLVGSLSRRNIVSFIAEQAEARELAASKTSAY